MIGVAIAWHLVCKRGVWTTLSLPMNANCETNIYSLGQIPKIWVAIFFTSSSWHLEFCVSVCVWNLLLLVAFLNDEDTI
jgi:hypothetical protein